MSVRILSSYLALPQAPIVVFDDADMVNAVNGVAFAAFVASGQTCVSGARILIQERIYDSFMERFLEKTKSISRRIGNRQYFPSIYADANTYFNYCSDEPRLKHGLRHL